MAVEFKAKHTRGTVYDFDPADLIIKPELNGRHETPDIQWLIDDILERGQLQPVTIRSDGGAPVLVFGFSRWRAIAEINAKKLAAVPLKIRCTYFKGNELDAFKANIAENHFRNPPQPIDDAHNIVRLERWGVSLEEIAKTYRKPAQWVRDRMALLQLVEPAREAVKAGKIAPAAAAVIAKLSSEKQLEAVAKSNAEGFGIAQAREMKTGKHKVTLPELKKKLAEFWQSPPEGVIDASDMCDYLIKMIEGKL